MRDILICKHCEHFRENDSLFDTLGMRNPTLYEAYEGDDLEYSRNGRIHDCELFDGFWERHALKTEFFKLEITKICPYYCEQCLSLLNNELHDVNYGFTRYFSKTRVCQHCGRVIPNKVDCPICGYKKFKNYHKWQDMTLWEKMVDLFKWIVYLAVFFFAAWRYKWKYKEKL
jgi:hypothetical protein